MSDEDTIDLRETGLLWLINREVFHPRGYALALKTSDVPGEPPTEFTLLGDGKEPWKFALPDELEQELFDNVKGLMP